MQIEGDSPTFVQALRLLRSLIDARLRWLLTGAVLLVITSGGVAALIPLALKALIDSQLTPGHVEGVESGRVAAQTWHWGAAYLTLLCLARLLNDARPLLNGRVEQGLYVRMTERFFAHVLHLPMRELLRRRTGELIHGLSLWTAGSQLLINHLIGSTLPVLVEVLTMALVLAHLQQPLLLTLFGATGLCHLAIFALGTPRLRQKARAVSAAGLELHARLNDGVCHVETLRCFVAERQVQASVREAGAELEDQWWSLTCLHGRLAAAASIVFLLSVAASLTMAGSAVAHGQLTVGGLVLANMYMLQLVRPLEQLGSAARDVARAVGFLSPMVQLLSEPTTEEPKGEPALTRERADSRAAGPQSITPDITPNVAPNHTPNVAPHIGSQQTPRRSAPLVRIQNLHFSYQPGRPIFKGLNLELAAGCTTALVGPSGCGKSSLARLLLRLYAPDAGVILLDGQPIQDINLQALRSLIALVPQDTPLLHASLAENIALGVVNPHPRAITEAARGARLDTLVAGLARGLCTSVGERGLQLSGGERQRVAIARAAAGTGAVRAR